jgi:plastocyanin
VPGTAPSAGPLKVPADKLRSVLGITNVNFVAGSHHLALVDATLAGTPAEETTGILRSAAAMAALHSAPQSSNPAEPTATTTPVAAAGTIQVSIDNFSYVPKQLTVKAGTTVVWTNKDDIAHTVTSDDKVLASPLLDTNEKFQYTFTRPGKFPYYCKVHPMMTGVVEVQ